MTGYWRGDIEGGHKTGPHRTSIKAIQEYENTYLDPFGTNSYQTSGFKKKKGKVSAHPTMLSSKHIKNLEAVELPVVKDEDTDKQHKVFDSQDDAIIFGETLGHKLIKRTSFKAPEELQIDGQNPSSEYLVQRMWGLSANNPIRMIPTNENKWCVYWRPSLINNQNNNVIIPI
jgi:hypothetical protein